MLHKTLNAGNLFSSKIDEVHFTALILQVLVQFFNVVLDLLACLLKECVIESEDNIRPFGPFVDDGEVLKCEEPDL